jgi:hypothetical protein
MFLFAGADNRCTCQIWTIARSKSICKLASKDFYATLGIDRFAQGFSLANNTNLGLYEELHKWPERQDRWNSTMSAMALRIDFEFIVHSLPWTSYPPGTIVADVGGGNGTVSIGLAERLPIFNLSCRILLRPYLGFKGWRHCAVAFDIKLTISLRSKPSPVHRFTTSEMSSKTGLMSNAFTSPVTMFPSCIIPRSCSSMTLLFTIH